MCPPSLLGVWPMRVGIDCDGTIDAAPRQFQSMMSALRAAGHVVTVVTGNSSPQVNAQDFAEKANYLNQLGCGECYDDLVVLAAHPAGETNDLHDRKAQWLMENHVHCFIDNSKQNCKAAVKAGVPLVLCPWASRED